MATGFSAQQHYQLLRESLEQLILVEDFDLNSAVSSPASSIPNFQCSKLDLVFTDFACFVTRSLGSSFCEVYIILRLLYIPRCGIPKLREELQTLNSMSSNLTLVLVKHLINKFWALVA